MFKPLLLSILSSSLLIATANAEDWKSLFNGNDLTGWSVQCKPSDTIKTYWSVKDGAITVNSLGDKDHDYVWLQSDGEYADFELRLKFQAFKESPGNSGVQIRSRYDKGAGWLDGPQVDIHPPNPIRAGLIYDETRGAKRWIYPSLEQGNYTVTPEMANPKVNLVYGPEQWNEMVIIAKGTCIKTIVNGVVAADYDGDGILNDADHKKYNVGLKGHIALQLHHNDELKIRFKDIAIREL